MPRQESFSGGELAPELYARTGLPKFGSGLRRMRNYFAARQGAAVSRPGTDYCGEVKDSTAKVRLVPFVYSATSTVQNYVLEFGAGYVRFWSEGAQVLSGGVPYEVTGLPYTTADLPYLRFAQSGDVLTICHPGYPPAQLSRASNTSWSYAALSFDRPAATCTPKLERPLVYVTDTTHPYRDWAWKVTEVRRDTKGFVYESAPVQVTLAIDSLPAAYASGTTYALGDYVSENDHFYRSLQASNTGHDPASNPTWWALDDALSSKTTYSLPLQTVLYPDKPRTLVIASSYGNVSTDPNFITYRVYRGRDGVFGWVGDSKKASFVDTGDEPDFSLPPPEGRNPFKVYDATGALTRTEYPVAVAYFEERLIFAGTTQRPAYLFASATGDYLNFDSRLVPTADEELEFELASRRREEIRSLAGLDQLWTLTGESVWEVSGGGAPLSFDNISAKARSAVGASWLEPLIVGEDALLYVRTSGAGVRDLAFDLQRQGFVGADLSLVAQHLFLGHEVVDWAYAPEPWSLIWLVRDDGMLLSLTYDRGEGIWAFAWHDSDGADGAAGVGVFENVAVIPEGTESSVYVVVRRTINGTTKRYVERLSSRVLVLGADGTPDVKEGHALDCCVTYRGSAATSVSGLSHLEGKSVYAVADGAVIGPLAVSGGVVNLGLPSDAGATVVHVGLPFTPEMETLDPALLIGGDGRARQKAVSHVVFEVYNSRGLSAGQDSSHLQEWRQRQVSDSYGVPGYATDAVRVAVAGTYGKSARAFLRQTQPLPVTVLGLTLEVDVGGA